jgi:hypothetical protein
MLALCAPHSQLVRTMVDPDSRAYQMTKRLLAGRALTGS